MQEQLLEGINKSLHKKVRGKLRLSILSLLSQRYEARNSLSVKDLNDEIRFLRHTMAMGKTTASVIGIGRTVSM
jgi:hypothetical protein